jgi:hypothetical protein
VPWRFSNIGAEQVEPSATPMSEKPAQGRDMTKALGCALLIGSFWL